MQLAVRPLTAPPEHKISLAATSGPASASQSKKGALYSIAGIHNFANNERTSQQLFALARDGFMQRGAAANAANATSSASLQRSSASHQSLAQSPLSQFQLQSSAQPTHTTADFGSQRLNDVSAVSASEGESSRAPRVNVGTQLRSAAASGSYFSEPASGIGSGMHVALRSSYPTQFQSMLSRPATAMSQSQSASALPSRTALPRPLSALSLASRSKTERQQQQHGVRAASAMASPTARAAAGQTTTTQPPAAIRQQRSDDDEIARPHTSLGRAQTTQNAPTSNRLLAF